MRPLKMEFQAFGPYAGRECIDFDSLSRSGLLLICGDTGSGKTMILDAMTQVLYGKSSGGSRDDFKALRCNRCEPDTETFVRFEFEAKGNIYKFERVLKPKRVNLSENNQIYIKNDEGVFEPLYEKLNKSEMPKIAERLIGLDYEQFTQVIILPQGKFERFLEADSGKKSDILTEIFGAGRWDLIARTYYDSVKEEADKVIALKEKVSNILGGEGCETPEDLVRKLADERSGLQTIETEFESANYGEEKDKLLEDRELANKLLSLRKAKDDRIKAVRTAELNAAKRAEAQEAASKELASHRARENEKQGWILRKTELEAKRQLYIDADKVREAFAEADRAWQEARLAAAKAEKNLDKVKRSEAEALVKYERADAEHKKTLDAFARGAAGRLAAELKDGEKCPVCGSTDHPEPAEAEAGSVSSAQVDEKFEFMSACHDAWEAARKRTEKSREEVTTAQNESGRLENARTAAQQAHEASKAGMIEGIDTLSELDQKIKALDKDISVFDNKSRTLAEKAEKANVQLAEAGVEKEKAREEAEKAAQELEEVESKLGPDGRDGLDIDAIDRRLQRIDEETAAYQRKHGSKAAIIKRLTEINESVAEDVEAYNSQIADAEDALAFARQLRGDSGIGLGRYVLGVMFDQVVHAANDMLSRVHGGRYTLVRTEDSLTSARKKGLDLAVRDSFSETDAMRAAGSLSGGEKFLVSLALSIGMSTIARTDGINIDAMFIDEGFGSLDENSISDALSVLESIRGGESGNFVGIISHVEVLRDNIPSKLLVKKDRKTSTLEYTIG